MRIDEPKYSNEEAARIGKRIYDQEIGPKVNEEDRGKFVAIDMESGQWEMDTAEMAACDRLLGRIPHAQVWMTRVGLGYTHRFGLQEVPAMAVRVPKYSNEEAARLGDGIYERDIRSKMSEEDHGKYVAIDMDTGEWEMDPDEMVAGDILISRLPDAQIWMTRVGYGYIRSFGAGLVKGRG